MRKTKLGIAPDISEQRQSPISKSLKEHTLGHVHCPACDSLRATLRTRITANLPFTEAAAYWLSLHCVNAARGPVTAGYIKPATYGSYEKYIRTLDLFFGQLRLEEIHSGHLREYQRARLAGEEPFIRYRRPQDAKPQRKGKLVLPAKGKTPCPVKPEKVNQELHVLIRLLKRAGAWNEEMTQNYQPLLTEESDVPRALTAQEQELWLYTSQLKPEWMIVHWYSLVAFQTTLSTNELRGLQLGNIALQHAVITVPGRVAKRRSRVRTVPLNTPEVMWALEKLIERAKACGATDPQHYLFPFRRRGVRREFEGYVPERPMTESGIKNVWNEVRAATRLHWFRIYDTRHTAITRMAEAGVPIAVIQEYAGHVGDRMRQHYTHISAQAKRNWGVHAFQRESSGFREAHPSFGYPPQPVRPSYGMEQGMYYRKQ